MASINESPLRCRHQISGVCVSWSFFEINTRILKRIQQRKEMLKMVGRQIQCDEILQIIRSDAHFSSNQETNSSRNRINLILSQMQCDDLMIQNVVIIYFRKSFRLQIKT